MSLVTRNHYQTITVWTSKPDGFGGFTFSAPVTCKGRWEDVQKAFIEPQGTESVSRAVVYLEVDAHVDDYVCLDDQTGHADPTIVAGALPIRQFLKTPTLRASAYERKAIL